jgi:hypothetical protein
MLANYTHCVLLPLLLLAAAADKIELQKATCAQA